MMQRKGELLGLWSTALLAGLAACQGGMIGGGGSRTSNGSASGLPTDAASNLLIELPIRHLLAREVLQSYDDLLGNNVSAAVPANVLQSDVNAGGFDNDISLQSMSSVRLDGYMTAAKLVSEAALTSDRAQATLGCPTATIDASCMKTFVAAFGRRAFRRPLSDDEVAQYAGLFATESNSLDGAKLVLRGLLSAPAFLYQPELGSPLDAQQGTVKLTPYELATKLSYLFLGTTPSNALLDAAQNGQLATADDVASCANDMLETPAGKAYLRHFALNWLGIGDAANSALTGTAIDTSQLHADMPEEALRLFDDYAKPGAHIADIYASPYTYITPSLAAAYNVPAPPAGEWTKLDLTGKPRLGLLTTPALLNVTGLATYPSIKRGKYVLETLLCQSAGSPPASASAVVPPADSAGKSERDQLAAHLTNPSCQGCHNIMDPPGFGFEQYNADGNYMTVDSKNRPLTGEGAVVGTGGFSFVGAPDLGKKLATNNQAQKCIAQKLAQYLLGRQPADGDAALVDSLDTSLRAKDLPATLIEYVRSSAFMTRKL